MSSPSLKRIYDTAKMSLPGALDGAIQMEFFQLLNDFFTTTNCWYEDIDFSVTPAGAGETYLTAPEEFTYMIVPYIGSITRLGWVSDLNGSQVAARMPVLGDLILNNSPSVAQTYIARVFLTVTDPVTTAGDAQCPDWVLNRYGSDLSDGLIGRMMAQPAKPYTSLQNSVLRSKNYVQARSQAKVEASRQNLYGGQNWRFPQSFARPRGQKF